jgi:hypothetical protein
MTVPAERKSLNIRRSFTKFFRTAFELPNGMQHKVNYGDASFDSSLFDDWVVINFLADMAGKKGFTLVQVDALTLIAGRRSGGDRFGVTCQQLADKIHASLHVESMPLYDFTSTPTAPTLIAKKKLVIQNSSGVLREPEEVRPLQAEEGLNRMILTYRILTLGDYAKAKAYYD